MPERNRTSPQKLLIEKTVLKSLTNFKRKNLDEVLS